MYKQRMCQNRLVVNMDAMMRLPYGIDHLDGSHVAMSYSFLLVAAFFELKFRNIENLG